jgi:hypothetical protein
MFYKCSVAVVVLAACAGILVADDKEKKEAKKEANKQEAIKGSVSKFDKDKHSLTLKTADGEKDYILAEDVVIVFGTGQKVPASSKPGQQAANRSVKAQGPQALQFVLKKDNKVELVLAEKGDTVKEIHFDNRTTTTTPTGKTATEATKKFAPKPSADGTKKDAPDGAKKDAPKKDDGK